MLQAILSKNPIVYWVFSFNVLNVLDFTTMYYNLPHHVVEYTTLYYNVVYM